MSWISNRNVIHRGMLALAAMMLIAGCGDEEGTLPGTRLLCDPFGSGDVVVESQADLDALADLSVVHGDVIICSVIEILTIDLPNLTEVDGNLLIFSNPGITSISIPALTSVGANGYSQRPWHGLLIDANAVLTGINLDTLRSVDQHVWLGSNDALTDFDLPGLVRVSGSITLKATKVTSVTGFGSLRTVGSGLTFFDNTALTSIAGFANLSTISNDLVVSRSGQDTETESDDGPGNSALTSLSLPLLHVVGRELTIDNAPLLGTLDLPLLRVVGDELTLDGTALTDLTGMVGLEIVGTDLTIKANAALLSASLPALTSIGGFAAIIGNAAMTDIGMPLLTYIGDDLTIRENVTLTGIDLTLLGAIGGNLSFIGNTGLDCAVATGLRDAVTLANIGGTVSITGNGGTCPP